VFAFANELIINGRSGLKVAQNETKFYYAVVESLETN